MMMMGGGRGGRASSPYSGGGGPPPPGYANDAYFGNGNGQRGMGMDRQPSPALQHAQTLPEDEFIAGPIGQAIEMDERTGSPPAVHGNGTMSPSYGLRDSDGDVAGMVGLQRERRGDSPYESAGPLRGDEREGMGGGMMGAGMMGAGMLEGEGRENGVGSPGSVYSDQ